MATLLILEPAGGDHHLVTFEIEATAVAKGVGGYEVDRKKSF
jgi:hypothetical protein